MYNAYSCGHTSATHTNEYTSYSLRCWSDLQAHLSDALASLNSRADPAMFDAFAVYLCVHEYASTFSTMYSHITHPQILKSEDLVGNTAVACIIC